MTVGGPDTIIDFWFVECAESAWWKKDARFDLQLRERFFGTWTRAAAGELWSWRDSDEGRLAEIILLDQFSRNFFRGDARAFAQDAMALALSQEAVRAGTLARLEPRQRCFLVMPYMHSESLAVHDEAMKLFAGPGLEGNLDFERRHRDIIARFGRYPHRNEALVRRSSPEELAFLEQPGSSF